MRKNFKKWLGAVMAVAMVVSSVPLTAGAVSPSTARAGIENASASGQAPLKVEIKANKEKYSLLGKMEFTATITNTSTSTVENICAAASFGKDLRCLKGSQTTTTKNSLAPGASFQFKYYADLNGLKGLDVLLYPIFWISSLFHGGKADTGNGQSGSNYAEESKSVGLSSLFGKQYDASTTVRAYHGADISIDGKYTRGQWIQLLMDKVGLSQTANATTSPFTDIKNSPYAKAIESARQQGILPISSGQFQPNEWATREFAAYTVVKAMGDVPKEIYFSTSSIPYWDYSKWAYPDEIEDAIRAGFMALIERVETSPAIRIVKVFLPGDPLSVADVNFVFARVDEIKSNSSVLYADGVIVDPLKTITYTISENNGIYTVTLPKSSATSTITNGTVFVLPPSNNELAFAGIALKATSVSEKNNSVIVTCILPELYEVTKSLNIDFEGEPAIIWDFMELGEAYPLLKIRHLHGY